jgi:hypothetical protein
MSARIDVVKERGNEAHISLDTTRRPGEIGGPHGGVGRANIELSAATPGRHRSDDHENGSTHDRALSEARAYVQNCKYRSILGVRVNRASQADCERDLTSPRAGPEFAPRRGLA